jgi:hypothetical protein
LSERAIMQKSRYPTPADFAAARTFCVLLVVVDHTTMRVKTLSTASTIEKDRGGNLRINPYGLIEHLRLGELQPQSSGAFGSSNVVVDYSENLLALKATAAAACEKLRETYVQRLLSHVDAFKALAVVTEGTA